MQALVPDNQSQYVGGTWFSSYLVDCLIFEGMHKWEHVNSNTLLGRERAGPTEKKNKVHSLSRYRGQEGGHQETQPSSGQHTSIQCHGSKVPWLLYILAHSLEVQK